MRFLDRLLAIVGLRKRPVNVLVIGLDHSGKSTIVNTLRSSQLRVEQELIAPTVGFNIERASYRNLSFTIFDMSGHGRYRDLWTHYYADVHGIVFVVDMSDAERLDVVKEELSLMLEDGAVRNSRAPLLVFANKMDLPHEQLMDLTRVADILGLDAIRSRNWHLWYIGWC